MPSTHQTVHAKLLIGAYLLKFQQIRESALNVPCMAPHGAVALHILRPHIVLPALASTSAAYAHSPRPSAISALGTPLPPRPTRGDRASGRIPLHARTSSRLLVAAATPRACASEAVPMGALQPTPQSRNGRCRRAGRTTAPRSSLDSAPGRSKPTPRRACRAWARTTVS